MTLRVNQLKKINQKLIIKHPILLHYSKWWCSTFDLEHFRAGHISTLPADFLLIANIFDHTHKISMWTKHTCWCLPSAAQLGIPMDLIRQHIWAKIWWIWQLWARGVIALFFCLVQIIAVYIAISWAVVCWNIDVVGLAGDEARCGWWTRWHQVWSVKTEK